MNENNFQKSLEDAAAQLRQEQVAEDGPKGFEHDVWTEISVRERSAGDRWWVWLTTGPRGMVAASLPVILAVVLGILLGWQRAEDAQQQALREQEEAYVTSIHPVLLSRAEPAHLEVHQ